MNVKREGNLPPESSSVPILSEVDVLVVGSTSAAVAASLEVARSGRSVMLVSDLSYLGSDLAGMFQLWPGDWGNGDPLLQAAFAESSTLPARPGAIKRALEEELLAARIPFLFQSRPVSLLRGDSGEIAGAVFAVRTSLVAITCRAVIDATEHGIVARLAGLPRNRREEASSAVEWTVLGTKPPEVWLGAVEEISPAFLQKRKEEDAMYRAFRLRIPREALGPDPMAAEHVARSFLVDENILITADLLVDSPLEFLGATSGLKDSLTELDSAMLRASDGLWMLSGMLPLSAAGLEDFRNPARAIGLGRHLGREVAATVPSGSVATSLHVQKSGSQTGDFRYAEVFLRGERQILTLDDWAFPALESFDVVVSGGGTGGAPAGIAAARSGASTLVLEMQHGLGGVGTLGLISSYWFGNRVGFTAELNEEVNRVDSWSRSKDGASWKPGVKSQVYHRMLQEAGGRAWLGSFAFGVKMEGKHVVGLLVSTPFGSGLVACGSVVDATGNSDIAAAAGAPCRVIGAQHVAVQGAGMSSRAHPDSGYQNSDHTFIDDADPVGVTSAFVHARAKYPHDFDTVSMVNSRERRQIVGELEVSPLDILAQRTFPDTVFVACSNFDTHGFTIHPVFMMAPPDHEPIRANVPFRCMLPQGIDGVIVTGLGMSAHRDALPLLRMQADVQNQGYVAGLAAAKSADSGVALRDLDIRALQRELVAAQILEPGILVQEDSFPMSRDAVRETVGRDLGELMNIAVLLAHPAESREPLLDVMANDSHRQRRNDAARILGMLGEPAAAPILKDIVSSSLWDEGWNYRGMGQFGRSMSWLDSVVIALGKTRSPEAIEVIEVKIGQLNEKAEFSHCRAVALAAAMLPDPRLAAALEHLLGKPELQGHVLQSLDAVRTGANGDPNETEARNLSLREIYLAMGLFLSGDPHGIGRAILNSYTFDLRGQLARYSRALLNNADHEQLRCDLA